jgi:hypothetical protein
MAVYGQPAHGHGANPQGKLRLRAFAQRLEMVNLHKYGRRGELFEDACIVVEGGNGRAWGIYHKKIVECGHFLPLPWW